MDRHLTHASLFSGIGGFDYAAALLGWINIFDCEIDAFCRKVLEYHFPNSEVYEELYKHYGSEDLSGLWQVIQQEKVRFEIGRLYEIPQPDILLQIMQRTSQAGRFEQSKDKLSPWSKETSKRVLCYLRNNPKLASSSLGQKYKEQYRGELTDTLSKLSHGIALATKKIIEECEKTSLRVRQESVKAYGNAIVPQVAYEIFKAIELCQ